MDVRLCECETGISDPATEPSTSGELPDISTMLAEHGRVLRMNLYDTLAHAVEQLTGRGGTPWDPAAVEFAWEGVEVQLEHVGTPDIPWSARVPRVLDVGCGRGELLCRLRQCGFRVEGLDREPECVRMASRYAPCWIGSGEDVEEFFLPGDFDCIVSSHVLEHVPHPLRLLEALRRMEARSYVFAVPNPLRPARLVRALLGSSRPDHPMHLHSWGRPEFQVLLGRAGFRVTGWLCDRVTIQPLSGRAGTRLSRALAPLETRLLPKLFPLFSSSLIATCIVDHLPAQP